MKPINIKEAAAYLDVSTKTVRKYAKNGLKYTIEKTSYGEEYRFFLKDLDAWKASPPYPVQGFKPPQNGQERKSIFPMEPLEDEFSMGPSKGSKDSPGNISQKNFSDDLISHLQEEILFLREQLREKDEQIRNKDQAIHQLTAATSMLSLSTDPQKLSAVFTQNKNKEKSTPSKKPWWKRIISVIN